jgi:hypothetical protein
VPEQFSAGFFAWFVSQKESGCLLSGVLSSRIRPYTKDKNKGRKLFEKPNYGIYFAFLRASKPLLMFLPE